jgi:hypothetical protein
MHLHSSRWISNSIRSVTKGIMVQKALTQQTNKLPSFIDRSIPWNPTWQKSRAKICYQVIFTYKTKSKTSHEKVYYLVHDILKPKVSSLMKRYTTLYTITWLEVIRLCMWHIELENDLQFGDINICWHYFVQSIFNSNMQMNKYEVQLPFKICGCFSFLWSFEG